MIEIITAPVAMPKIEDRRFKKETKGGRWVVIDTNNGSIRYKGSYENVSLACHNLNKGFYKHQGENPSTCDATVAQ